MDDENINKPSQHIKEVKNKSYLNALIHALLFYKKPLKKPPATLTNK